LISVPSLQTASCIGISIVVESRSSKPAVNRNIVSTSSAVRARTPTVSNEDPYAIKPYRETRPYVGLMPVTPQKEAGWRTLPPVSVPNAAGENLAVTAAADPPLDPPGTRSTSQGLCVTPYAEFSVDEPIANSSVFVFPSTTMPASNNFCTAVALKGGLNCSRIFDPHVARTPSTHSTSLIAIGSPKRGGTVSPAFFNRTRLISAPSAISKAISGVVVINAWISFSCAEIRSRNASVISLLDTRPFVSASTASLTLKSVSLVFSLIQTPAAL